MRCDIPELEPDKLAEMARSCACFNFRKASRSVTQLFDQILAPTGLRSTQLVILIAAQVLMESSIARLARELVMDRSTLTRNLRPLLTMGLLKVSRAPDGKHKSVELTDAGRKALVQSAPYWEKAQSHLMSRFESDHWNRIMGDLSAIVDATRASAV